jgi:hypothetical protein
MASSGMAHARRLGGAPPNVSGKKKKLTGNDASPRHIIHIRQEPLGHRHLTRTDDGAKQASAHFECELNRSIEILWVR